MKTTLLVFFLLFLSVFVSAQKQDNDAAELVHFVAPAYPRAAKDQRIMGTTVTRVTVRTDGAVGAATTVRSHPIFENYVLEALKQWKFKPSSHEHTLEITCSFEFYDEDCDKPLTPETSVSAELPTMIRIRSGLQCVQASTSASMR